MWTDLLPFTRVASLTLYRALAEREVAISRVAQLCFAGLIGLALLSGCQAKSRPAVRAAVVPKGVTETISAPRVTLSAWVPTETIDSTRPLDVRLTLRNDSDRTLRLSSFNFGLVALTSYKRRSPADPDGAALAWGPQLEDGRSFERRTWPLVLGSGETTYVVHPLQLSRATWSVKGFAFMDDESLQTPTITVVAH